MRKKIIDTNEDVLTSIQGSAGAYVIKSDHIEVFPCVSREEKYNTDSIIASEFNITHIPSVGVKSNYVIKCEALETEVVVGGYVFRLSVTKTELTNKNIKYFKILLVAPGTEVDNAQAILANIAKGTTEILDGSGYFYGLAFCTEDSTIGYSAQTGINETMTIVPVSGTDDGSNWKSITIGDKSRNIPAGTVKQVNKKTPDTNGAVTIVASDINTSQADVTVQKALTNLNTAVNNKSKVSASTTGTSTTEVKYLTIDTTEYKLPEGGGTGTSDFDKLSNRPKYAGSTMTHSTNIPTVPSIKLNGATTSVTSATIYVPTTAGTSGYVLKSSGSGAPTWSSVMTSGLYFDSTSPTVSYNGTKVITVKPGTGVNFTAITDTKDNPTGVTINVPSAQFSPQGFGNKGQVWMGNGSTVTPTWQYPATVSLNKTSLDDGISVPSTGVKLTNLGMSARSDRPYIISYSVNNDNPATIKTATIILNKEEAFYPLESTLSGLATFTETMGELGIINYKLHVTSTSMLYIYCIKLKLTGTGTSQTTTISETAVAGKIYKILQL